MKTNVKLADRWSSTLGSKYERDLARADSEIKDIHAWREMPLKVWYYDRWGDKKWFGLAPDRFDSSIFTELEAAQIGKDDPREIFAIYIRATKITYK